MRKTRIYCLAPSLNILVRESENSLRPWNLTTLCWLIAAYLLRLFVCVFRHRDTENILQAVTKKEEHLRRLWRARLSHQISELPPYNDVYRHVVRALRAADFN